MIQPSRDSPARALCGTRRAWGTNGPSRSATTPSRSCRRKPRPAFFRFSPRPTAAAAPRARFPRRTPAGFFPRVHLPGRTESVFRPAIRRESEASAAGTRLNFPAARKKRAKNVVSKNWIFETGFFARKNRLLLIFFGFCVIFFTDIGTGSYVSCVCRGRNTDSVLRDQPQPFELPLVLRAALNEVNSRRFD